MADERLVKALLEALEEAEKIKPFQVAKRRVLARYGLQGTGKDRYITALMYKLYRLQGVLDRAAASALGTTPEEVRAKPALVRQALRLAAFLAQFSNPRDPDLERNLLRHGLRVIAERHGWREARQVAKVLERLRKRPWKPGTREEEMEYKYMIPYELYERLLELLGSEEEVRAFVESLNREPPLGLRVNTLKTSVDEVLGRLREAGIEAWPSERVPGHIRYRGMFHGALAELVEEGLVIPQDESSALAAVLLDPRPGERIADLCAAPGGKTTHLAELARLQAVIVAFDVYADRLERLLWLADRIGTRVAIEPLMGDGRAAPEILGEEWADKVLVDPPCTSTGALAKHPDARWRLSRENLEYLTSLQYQLAEAGLRLLRPGGRMLYTVCSVLPEEGEHIVQRLLHNHPEARLVPLRGPYEESRLLPGTMRAWPHKHNTTGFYYALIEKKED